MIKNFKKRLKSNKGAAATIEMVIMSALIFIVLLLVLDFGVYFINRNTYTMAAENGARLAAIYGGAGPTPISQKYGINEIKPKCSQINANSPAACAMVLDLIDSRRGIINSEPVNAVCGPTMTGHMGERVWCEINWRYYGVPGSIVSRLLSRQTTRVSAESEVVSRDFAEGPH